MARREWPFQARVRQRIRLCRPSVATFQEQKGQQSYSCAHNPESPCAPDSEQDGRSKKGEIKCPSIRTERDQHGADHKENTEAEDYRLAQLISLTLSNTCVSAAGGDHRNHAAAARRRQTHVRRHTAFSRASLRTGYAARDRDARQARVRPVAVEPRRARNHRICPRWLISSSAT